MHNITETLVKRRDFHVTANNSANQARRDLGRWSKEL